MQRRILYRLTWLAAALSLGHHFGPATGGQPTINPPTAVAGSAAVTGSTRPTHGSGCTARWRELAAPQQPANPEIRVDPARPAPGYEVMHRTVTYGVVCGSRRAPGRWGP
jgi:hypothetical protein